MQGRNHRNSSEFKYLFVPAGLAVFWDPSGRAWGAHSAQVLGVLEVVSWRAPSNRRQSCHGGRHCGACQDCSPAGRRAPQVRQYSAKMGIGVLLSQIGRGSRPGRRLGQAQATRRQGRAPLAPHQPHAGEPHPHLCPAQASLLLSVLLVACSMRSHALAARRCTASPVQLASKAAFWLLSCICLLANLHLSKRGWCDDESGGPSHSPSCLTSTVTVWSPFQPHLLFSTSMSTISLYHTHLSLLHLPHQGSDENWDKANLNFA